MVATVPGIYRLVAFASLLLELDQGNVRSKGKNIIRPESGIPFSASTITREQDN